MDLWQRHQSAVDTSIKSLFENLTKTSVGLKSALVLRLGRIANNPNVVQYTYNSGDEKQSTLFLPK